MPQPLLSLVVLTWNNLELTRACVDSLKAHTDVDFELIVVDNASEDGTAAYAGEHADIAVLHEQNFGFARGMNAGLAEASGEYVAFINNDTRFPQGWARKLVQTFAEHPRAGIVLPAVTAAGNPVSVRDEPGSSILVLTPFGEFPSGVVYLLRRELMTTLGGWNESYDLASAEDLDLAFTVWAHDLDVILDERVLVQHESQASMKRLPDLDAIYSRNLAQFLEIWADPSSQRPKLTIDPDVYDRNLERARTAVIWIRRMLEARSESKAPPSNTGASRPRWWLKSRS